MSDHTWTLENLAAHVAGGLEPDERQRLERHLAECADCRGAHDAVRADDERLMTLFADVRPDPTLEDRMIRSLRGSRRPVRRKWTFGVWAKVAMAAAAAVMLALVGAALSALNEDDMLALERIPVVGPQVRMANGIDEDDPVFGVPQSTEALNGLPGDKSGAGIGGGLGGLGGGLGGLGGGFGGLGGGLGGLAGIGGNISHGPNVRQMGIPNQSPAKFADQLRADSLESLKQPVKATKRKPAVSVPGTLNPNEAVGIKDGDKQTPRFNAPPGGGGRRVYPVGDLVVPLDKAARALDGTPTPPPSVAWTSPSTGRPAQSKAPAVDAPTVGLGFGVSPGSSGSTGKSRAGFGFGKNSPGADKEKFNDFLNSSFTPGNLGGQKKPPTQQPPEPIPASKRYIIRTGDIDFEVDSFDNAVAEIQKLVAVVPGGYIATINSDKLVNGKVKGQVVVRIPPEHLDKFVLDLRRELSGKKGELKGQRIGSQDVSKNYTDLESRLRAARTMQDRLLKIIKDGKGDIKDLVAAEKELGVWNTKIEEIEGELRYYGNLIALSTLTINLSEKEIRLAAAVRQSERVQAGVEVDDVEKAMREVLKAVTAAKGRITRSEMKQQSADKFNAQLDFEVAPEKAGPVRDQLNQIGTVVRLEIDRVQTAEGGDKLPQDGKLEQGNTRFLVSLYNLANSEARETVTMTLAATDVVAAYQAVRAALVKAKARVVNANLSEQDRQNVTGQLDFDVRRTDESNVLAALTGAGEVLTRQVARAAEGANVTDKKVMYKVALVPASTIEPREVVSVAIEAADVEGTLSILAAQVKELQGRIVKDPDVANEPDGNVIASVVYEVPLTAAPAFADKLRHAGTIRGRRAVPNPKAPEGKLAIVRYSVTLTNGPLLLPRDESLVAQVRKGVSLSLRGLSVSVNLLIVGVLFVLPWAIVILAIVWIVRRLVRTAPVTTPPTGPTPPSAPVAG